VLLLDTHVWVWSVGGDERRIGPRTRRLLARVQSADALRVSPVTLFELSALHTQGRLRFTRPLEQWLRESMEAPGVRMAECSPAIAIDAGTIPRTALADPLDRLLVSTARQLDATFVTADAQILAYAARRRDVRVHDGTR
jgi:PIN domain nuclease of toxin-antitoxin system